MYQVIIILDEKRNKSYYQSYVESDNTNLGNITCSDLPPYQDINKARACYWDSNTSSWVFDEEKYTEIMAAIEAEKAAQEAKNEISVVMNNEQLTEGLMELAGLVGNLLEQSLEEQEVTEA